MMGVLKTKESMLFGAKEFILTAISQHRDIVPEPGVTEQHGTSLPCGKDKPEKHSILLQYPMQKGMLTMDRGTQWGQKDGFQEGVYQS